MAAVALVLSLGGYMVTAGAMGLGTLTTFILYSQRLFEPLRQLAERFTQIQGGLTAVERISELLEKKIEIYDQVSQQVVNKTRKESIKKPQSEKLHFKMRFIDLFF